MTCSACRHYQVTASPAQLLGRNGAVVGECRRFPPAVTHIVTDNGQVQPFSAFAPVRANWTCGEFTSQTAAMRPVAANSEGGNA